MHICPRCHRIVSTVRKVLSAGKKAVFKCLWCGTVLTTLFVSDLHEPPNGPVPQVQQITVVTEASTSLSGTTIHIFAPPNR